MALIVFIEESPLMRPAVRDLLQLDGHTVLTSGSAKEALDLLENIFGVDLVIANSSLPEMDGPVLIEQLRAKAEYQNIPILMWMVDDDQQSSRQLFDAGANDCLVRPITVARLTGTVQRMLNVTGA